MRVMFVIGITGNFGTGKTTVSQMLAELGAVPINADELGHELLQPGTETHGEILAAFGKSILKPNWEIDPDMVDKLFFPHTEPYHEGLAEFFRRKSILKPNWEIDRKKLGKLVFNDNKALARLNRITHPRIYEIVRQKIEEYRQAGTGVVVLEAALFIEAGWQPLVDQLWVTTAPEATIVKRLKSSRGLSEEQVLTRLRAQMPQEEKAKQADVVVNTDCSMDELRARVTELWHRLPAETDS